MLTRIFLVVVIAAGIFFGVSGLLMAQSKEEGIRLFHEAKELQEKAQTSTDLQQAAQKYQQALKIFELVGFKRGIDATANNLGPILSNWGQYEKAMKYYEKSLAIKRKLKDRKGEGRTLNNLGNVFDRWRQYGKAVDCYQKSLLIFRQLKDRRGEGAALNNLGLVYEDWGQHDKAVECYEKSLAIKRKLKDRKGEGQSLMNLGTLFANLGQHDKSVAYYQKSLAIARELKNPTGMAKPLDGLGAVFSDWGQYDKAVEYHQKSLAIGRELGDREGEGKSLNNLGNAFSRWGQYDKAADCYEKSLTIFRELKDPKGESGVLNNLGNVFDNRGQYDRAVEYHQKSLAIDRELEYRWGEGKSLNNLGNAFSRWGQYDKAADCYEKSLTVFRELKDPKDESGVLNNLGVVFKNLGQYDRAVECYEKSLAIKRKLKDPKGEGDALNNLGNIFQHRGEYQNALENFQKGLAIFTDIKIPTNLPKALIAGTYMDMGDLAKAERLLREAGSNAGWGRFHLLKADYPKAKEHYGKILKSAEESRDAENLFKAYTGLAAACEGLKDDVAAKEYYEKVVKHTEDLRSSLSPAEREKFFDVRIDGFFRTAPYEGLARVLLRLNRPQEAFKSTEYTRARVFSEAMTRLSGGKNFAVPPEILRQDNLINNELASLKKNLQKAFEKSSKLVIQSLEPQVKEMEGKLQAHIKMLRDKYPLFAATKYPQPMDLSQTAVKDNEWILSYDLTDPGLLIYLTKGKTLVNAWFKPVPRKEIDELARKFREPLEIKEGRGIDQLKEFDFASGKKLTDVLLSDVLPLLPKDAPVIIVPGGSLGIVPFEMLVLNDSGRIATDKKVPYISGAEFFGDRNPISYYQSVTALTLARTLGKQQTLGTRTLAMVDPIFAVDDARFAKAATDQRRAALDKLTGEKLMSFRTELKLEVPRLPLTGQLGESLKKADPTKTDLYEGLKAQKAVLLKNDLTPYRSCVFATHGYFGKDLPGIKEPVLILTLPNQPDGQDGFLRTSEVMGLKLNADMVALTACQSGLGRVISGEGAMGMGRAFQYAGAKSVLMSLWSVAESSSVDLVTSFFKHLREGKNKLEALKLARDEIRKAGYDHPFFWAPFILVGEVD